MSDRDDLSLLPLGGNNDPDAETLSPTMQACARNLYQQAWREYRAVGCPYGQTDEAMLVWYSLDGNAPGSSPLTGKN
jgi:hypothetical protein